MKTPPFREVAEELRRLVELSLDLRQAMLERKPERILEVAARGDELRASPALASATAEMLADEEIGPLVQHLRRLQESNRLLATAFLKVYRQILRPVGAEGGGEAGAYGHRGLAQGRGGSPFLIHQIG